MIFLRKNVNRERRNERKATFRPTLESLECRDLLSATAFDPVPIQASSQATAPISLSHQTAGSAVQASTAASPLDGTGSGAYTPDQIRHAYGFDQIYFNNGTIAGDGRGQTIAIIEASSDPNIGSDAWNFNAEYNLPQFNAPGGPSLTLESLSINGQRPTVDQSGEGELETALDVEWAHAIAPEANIMVVYAPVQLNSNGSWNDSTPLYRAAQWAAKQAGVSVVSMSFGGGGGTAANDSYFLTPKGHNGVTFVASAGDQGAFLYPASSINVLAVGGTALKFDSAGNYGSEKVWNDGPDAKGVIWSSGGGQDPSYSRTSDNPKSGPDVGYNAVNYSVYDSYSGSIVSEDGFIPVRGTSAGAPQWAALIAIADQGRALDGQSSLDGASQTLPMLYHLPSSDFHTNIPGFNQYNVSSSDVFGLGTPYANLVVSGLSGQPIDSQPSTSQPPNQTPPTQQWSSQQPPTQQSPSTSPSPYSELAADALLLVQGYESGNMGGVFSALMDFESLVSQFPALSPMKLEQVFINDIMGDL